MSLFDGIFRREGRKGKRRNTAAASLFDTKSAFFKGEDTKEPSLPLKPTPSLSEVTVSVQERPQAAQERTVFVGNVALEVKQLPKKLKRHFAACGDVESVRLRSVPAAAGDHAPKRIIVHNRRFRQDGVCNAYVVFKHAQGAQAALELNMTQFHGQALRVDMASEGRFRQRRKKTMSDPGNFAPHDSICVKHLDVAISDEALLEVFNDGALVPLCKGMVRNWRIVRDHRTGESKGYAFVAFKRPAAAKAARVLNGYTLGKQQLKIEPLTPSRTHLSRITERAAVRF